MSGFKILGLVYDTASAHVIQVVKIGCKSRYHSHRDGQELEINYPNYLRSLLFELKMDSESLI